MRIKIFFSIHRDFIFICIDNIWFFITVNGFYNLIQSISFQYIIMTPKLGKSADDKNTLISNVLVALNGIDFGLNEASDIDILGDAYEYMIGQFAAGAGKKAGEFYTPQEVSQILAEIVTTGKTRLRYQRIPN